MRNRKAIRVGSLKPQKMKLLKNEEKLLSSNADKIVLTNQRIMMAEKVWGKSIKISICLEDISSVEIHYRSYIVFLILGIILALAELIMIIGDFGNFRFGGILLGIIFIAIWWFTRKHLNLSGL